MVRKVNIKIFTILEKCSTIEVYHKYHKGRLCKMKRGRRTLFSLITVILLLTMVGQTACAKERVQLQEEECPFCDGDELTLEEKYEELLVKALIDEQNMLDDGIITREVYRLQCEPFQKALTQLKNATEEEILEGYQSILLYFYDETMEEEASGEVIDEDFLQYIEEQMEEYGVEM